MKHHPVAALSWVLQECFENRETLEVPHSAVDAC